MQGDATRRFCASCEKHVHDLSALSEAEARSLLQNAQHGSLCVQYTADASGQVQFAPARTFALRRKARPLLAGVAGSLLAACAAPVDGALPGELAYDGGSEIDGGWDAGAAPQACGRPDGPSSPVLRPGMLALPVAAELALKPPIATLPTGGGDEPGAPVHVASEGETMKGEPRYVRGRMPIPKPGQELGEVVMMGAPIRLLGDVQLDE